MNMTPKDRELLRKQEQLARKREEDILYVVRTLINDERGREFLWYLLDITNVDTTTFATNALVMSFRSGEQNIGLQVKAKILEANPAGFVQMLKERINANRTNHPADRTGNNGGNDDNN